MQLSSGGKEAATSGTGDGSLLSVCLQMVSQLEAVGKVGLAVAPQALDWLLISAAVRVAVDVPVEVLDIKKFSPTVVP